MITNNQLRKHKYNIKVLEENIDHLSLRTILVTQKLTADFCDKYFLSTGEFAWGEMETHFTISDIIKYQPHLSPSSFSTSFCSSSTRPSSFSILSDWTTADWTTADWTKD